MLHQNARARCPDEQSFRLQNGLDLERVVTPLLTDHKELFMQFSDSPQFWCGMADTANRVTDINNRGG